MCFTVVQNIVTNGEECEETDKEFHNKCKEAGKIGNMQKRRKHLPIGVRAFSRQ